MFLCFFVVKKIPTDTWPFFWASSCLDAKKNQKIKVPAFLCREKNSNWHTIFLPGQAKETNFIKNVTEYWEMGRGVGLRILFVKATDSKRVILRSNGSLFEFATGLAPRRLKLPQKTKPIPHC